MAGNNNIHDLTHLFGELQKKYPEVYDSLENNGVLGGIIEDVFAQADKASYEAAKRMSSSKASENGKQYTDKTLIVQVERLLNNLGYKSRHYSYDPKTGSIKMSIGTSNNAKHTKLEIPISLNNEFVRNQMHQNASLSLTQTKRGMALSGPVEQFLHALGNGLKSLQAQNTTTDKSGRQVVRKGTDAQFARLAKDVAKDLNTLTQASSHAIVDDSTQYEHGRDSRSRAETQKGLLHVRNAIRETIKTQNLVQTQRKILERAGKQHDYMSDDDLINRMVDDAWQYIAIAQSHGLNTAKKWAKDSTVNMADSKKGGGAIIKAYNDVFSDLLQIKNAVGFGSDESIGRGVIMMSGNRHRPFETYGDSSRHSQQTQNSVRRTAAARDAIKNAKRHANNLRTTAGQNAKYDYDAAEETLSKVAYVDPAKMEAAFDAVKGKYAKQLEKQYTGQILKARKFKEANKNLDSEELAKKARAIAHARAKSLVDQMVAPSLYDDMSIMGKASSSELESQRLRSFSYITQNKYDELASIAKAKWDKYKDKFGKFAAYSGADGEQKYIADQITRKITGRSVHQLGTASIVEKFLEDGTKYYDVQAQEIISAANERKILGDLTGSRTTSAMLDTVLYDMLKKELGIESGTQQIRLAKKFKPDQIPGLARGLLSLIGTSSPGHAQKFIDYISQSGSKYNYLSKFLSTVPSQSRPNDKDFLFNNEIFNQSASHPTLFSDLMSAIVGFENDDKFNKGIFHSGLKYENGAYSLAGNAMYINDILALPDVFDWLQNVKVSPRELKAMQRSINLAQLRNGSSDFTNLRQYLFGSNGTGGLVAPNDEQNTEAKRIQGRIGEAFALSNGSQRKIDLQNPNLISIGRGSQYTIDLDKVSDYSPSYGVLNRGKMSDIEYKKSIYGLINKKRAEMLNSGVSEDAIRIAIDPGSAFEMRSQYYQDNPIASLHGSNPNAQNVWGGELFYLPWIQQNAIDEYGETLYETLPFEKELESLVGSIQRGGDTNEAANVLAMALYGHSNTKGGSYFTDATSKRVFGSFSPHIIGTSPQGIEAERNKGNNVLADRSITDAWASVGQFSRSLRDARKQFTDDTKGLEQYRDALKEHYRYQRSNMAKSTGNNGLIKEWNSKGRELNDDITALQKAIIDNAKSGYGIIALGNRYPSIEGRDTKFVRLAIDQNLADGDLRLGAGLAKSMVADFDGDTVNFIMTMASGGAFDELTKAVDYDTEVSKQMYEIYKARGDFESANELITDKSAKSASNAQKTSIVSNASKFNKPFTGVFSNMNTRLRMALDKAGINEMGVKANMTPTQKSQYVAASLTQSLFQGIEQDAISSKKVEDRLQAILEGRGKAADFFNDKEIVDIYTQYRDISQKLLGQAGTYTQDQFFEDLTKMGMIKKDDLGNYAYSGSKGGAQSISSMLASGTFKDQNEMADFMIKQFGVSKYDRDTLASYLKKGDIPIEFLQAAFGSTNSTLLRNGDIKMPILPDLNVTNSAFHNVVNSRDFNISDKLDNYGLMRWFWNGLSLSAPGTQQYSAKYKKQNPGVLGIGKPGVSMGTTAYLHSLLPTKYGAVSDQRLREAFKRVHSNGSAYSWNSGNSDIDRATALGMSPEEYQKLSQNFGTTAFGTYLHAVAENTISQRLGGAHTVAKIDPATGNINNVNAMQEAEEDYLQQLAFLHGNDYARDHGTQDISRAKAITDSFFKYLDQNAANNQFVASEARLESIFGKNQIHGIADFITRDASGNYTVDDWKTNANGLATSENIWQNLAYQLNIIKMRESARALIHSGALSGLKGDDRSRKLAELLGYDKYSDENHNEKQLNQQELNNLYELYTKQGVANGEDLRGRLLIADKHGSGRIVDISSYEAFRRKYSNLADKLERGEALTEEENNRLLSDTDIAKVSDSFKLDSGVAGQSWDQVYNLADADTQLKEAYLNYIKDLKKTYGEIAKRTKLGLDTSKEQSEVEGIKKQFEELDKQINDPNRTEAFDPVAKEEIDKAKRGLETSYEKMQAGRASFNDARQRDYERAQNEMLHSELAIADAQRRMNLTSTPETLQSLQAIINAEKQRLDYLKEQVAEKGKLLTEDQKAEADAKYNLNKEAALAKTGARDGGAGNLWDKFAMGMQNQLKRYFDFTIIYGSLRKLAAKMKEVIQTSIQLNQVATDIRIVTGENKDRVDELMLSYSSLAKELGSTTSAVAQSANAWLRQGYSISEANELIKTSTYLSKLGMIDMSTATKVLTSTLKGFKMEATESLSIVDKLTELDKNYAASAGEIGEALSRVASVAQSVNLDLDKTASMIAIIMDVTQQEAGAVGTSVRSILSRYSNVKSGKFTTLSEDGDEDVDALNDVEKVLRAVGIQVRSSRMEMRAFDDVLGDLADKWGQLSTVEQNAISTAMAGTRQRNAFQALMDNYQRYQEAVETSQNSEGTAMTKWQAQQESVAFSLAQLKTAWEEFSQKVVNSDAIKALYNTAKFFVEALPFILSQVVSLISALNAFRIPKIVSGAKSFLSFRNSTLWKSAAYGVNADGTPRRGFLGGINGSDQTVNAINTNANMLNSTLRQIASNTGGLGALQQGSQQLGGVDGVLAKYTTKHGFIKKRGANGYQNLAKVITTENPNASDYSNGGWLFGKRIKSYQFNSPEEAQAYALLDQAYKEQVKHQAYVGVAAGLGAGITGALTSDSNKWGGFINKIAPNSAFGRINDVKSDGTDMAWNGITNGVATGVLAAIPGIGPILGPILGPIIGDGIGGLIKFWRHRDEIERKQRAEEAKKQLEALNKYTGAIDSAVSGLITKDQKDLTADDYTTLKAASEAAEELFADADVGTDFKERFESTLQDLTKSALDADTALSNLASGINSDAILAALKATEARTKAELTYAAAEEERYDISEKLKEAQENESKATSYEDRQKYRNQAEAYSRQLKAFDTNLQKGYLESAFYSSGISQMRADERGVASLDRVIYNVAKEWSKDNPNVFYGNGQINQDARNQIYAFLKSQAGFEGLTNGSQDVSIRQMYQRMSTLRSASGGRSTSDLLDIASNDQRIDDLKEIGIGLGLVDEKLANANDKLSEADLAELNKQLDATRDEINNMNDTTFMNMAHQLGMSSTQLESMTDKLGWLTSADIQNGVEGLKETFAGWNSIVEDLTDNLTLGTASIDTLAKKYPYLLLNEQGDVDISGVTQNLLKMVSGENSPALTAYTQMRANELRTSTDYWDLFKGTKTFKNLFASDNDTRKYLLSDALTKNFDDAYTYLARNGYGDLDKFMNGFADAMSELAGDPEITKVLEGKIDEWILHDFDLQIANLESIKDALDNINSDRETELKLIKARQKLENAQNEKRRVYRAGIGFAYEADQTAINEAQKELEALEREQEKNNVQYQIDLLKQQKDALEHMSENERWEAVQNLYQGFQDGKFKLKLTADDLNQILGGAIRNGVVRVKDVYKENTEKLVTDAVSARKEYAKAYSDYEAALKSGSTEQQTKALALMQSKRANYVSAMENASMLDKKDVYSMSGNDMALVQDIYGTETKESAIKTLSNMQDYVRLADGTIVAAKDVANYQGWSTSGDGNYYNRPDAPSYYANINGKNRSFTLRGNVNSQIMSSIEQLGNGVRNSTYAAYAEPFFRIYKIDTSAKKLNVLNNGQLMSAYAATKQNLLENGNYLIYDTYNKRWLRWVNGSYDNFWGIKGGLNLTGGDPAAMEAFLFGKKGYSDILNSNTQALIFAGYDENGDPKYVEYNNPYAAYAATTTSGKSSSGRPIGGKGGPQLYDLAYAADGSYNTSNGHYFINELGTEGIITPQGTLTALPSHSGIVPADLTRNLYTLGAIAPTLIKRWSDPNNVKLNKQNSVEDNSMNVQNLYATFETDDGFDFEQLLIQARQYVNNTKRSRT